jgi:tellurite resistance protein
MRELSPEIAEQLREQLERAAAGRSARSYGDKAEKARGVSARDGVIEAMFLLAAVDGKVTTLEVAQFADGIDSAFPDDTEADVEALVKHLAERLAKEGWDRRLAAVKEALHGTDLAETAYRCAASVAFVDDVIEHAEAAALEALAGALGIPTDRAQAILREVRTELFGA